MHKKERRWRTAIIASLAIAAVAIAACGQVSETDRQAKVQQEVEADIRSVIPDPARQAVVLNIHKRVQLLTKRMSEDQRLHDQALERLNANYDATEASFDDLRATRTAKVAACYDEALLLRAALVTATTDAEWKALEKARRQSFPTN